MSTFSVYWVRSNYLVFVSVLFLFTYREFTITRIQRPFYVNYNPTTEIVEVIRKKDPHTGATETNAASQT